MKPDAREGRAAYPALMVIAAVAWVATALVMRGMDDGPGTRAATLGFFVAVWLLMMTAMMLPTAAPVIATYSALRRTVTGGAGTVAGATAFVAGYLGTWAAAGIVGYGVEEVLETLSPLRWSSGGSYAAGSVLVLAAAYQLTPLKDRCLAVCRVPLSFMLSSWRDRFPGAAVMGARYGARCVGCCWAMLAALFALGFMNVVWMAVIAVLIASERFAPSRRTASLAVAIVLFALGVLLAVAPGSIPGLTLPGTM